MALPIITLILLKKHLWRHIFCTATKTIGDRAVDNFGKTKIRQPYVAICINDNILRLQVPV